MHRLVLIPVVEFGELFADGHRVIYCYYAHGVGCPVGEGAIAPSDLLRGPITPPRMEDVSMTVVPGSILDNVRTGECS